MVNVIYNDSIPDAPNNPSQDQPKMQTNTNSIRSLVEIDHIGFGNNQGGYHKTVHQPVVGIGGQTSWNPIVGSVGRLAVEAAKILGVQQEFILNYTTDSPTPATDTQLFSMTGKGGVSQLTGNAAQQEGWCWCGGILLQWGEVNSALATDTVTFKGRSGTTNTIPFPNNCFGITIQPRGVTVKNINAAVTATTFTWGSNVANNIFFWFAWGN